MPGYRQRLGAWGEKVAERELVRQGLEVVERNHRTSEGEIDLVARDGDLLVIVEVRTRRGGPAYGTPEESVTPAKQARLIALARAYVAEVGWTGPWRIDVVGVHADRQGRLQGVNWIPNAIQGG